MVYLILGYLIPLLMMIVHRTFLKLKDNKVIVKFLSPFAFFMSVLNGVSVIICLNILYEINKLFLITLVCTYLALSLHNLLNFTYLSEKYFVYGFRKIKCSLISFEIINKKVVIRVGQEKLSNVYVNKTNLKKLKAFIHLE